MTKVSCLVLIHDKPDYALDAIQSVLDQSYPHYQATVWDSGVLYDAGYYDSMPCFADDRWQLIRSDETQEIRDRIWIASWVFNQWIARGIATGDLILTICDDDIFYPNCFTTFVDYYDKHHPLAMYASEDVIWMNKYGDQVVIGERRAKEMGGFGGKYMDYTFDYLQLCITRKILDSFVDREYIPEDLAVKRHADGLFMERVGCLSPIHPIDVKIGANRHTPSSLTKPPMQLIC